VHGYSLFLESDQQFASNLHSEYNQRGSAFRDSVMLAKHSVHANLPVLVAVQWLAGRSGTIITLPLLVHHNHAPQLPWCKHQVTLPVVANTRANNWQES
jgi:hypothetical protein